MVASGPVAVSYTGCELHIVSECSLGKGKYEFQRTTVDSDTVEISNDDDLYAKLPLGAARLEADLQRSGRLAVHTTVAGMHRLSGAGVADVPAEGECGKATHLVTQLTVGAFKLFAGGKAKASAAAGVGSIGAGGTRAEEEVTLTEAGDPKACDQTGDQPNANCGSPIQIFLQPLPGRTPAQGPSRQAMAEEKPPADAVRVNFSTPSSSERWSLLTLDGKLVCDLPCSRWVPPNSGYKLQLDADRKEDIQIVSLPSDLGYSAGRTVDATALGSRGSIAWPIVLGTTGFVSALTGLMVILCDSGGGGGYSSGGGSCQSTASHPDIQAVGGILIGAGAAMGIGALFTGLYTRTQASVDLTLTSGAQTGQLRLRPGFIEAGKNDGARVIMSPSGIAGSF
jgi:hypothetical protein